MIFIKISRYDDSEDKNYYNYDDKNSKYPTKDKKIENIILSKK
jgi:hypothetical protein